MIEGEAGWWEGRGWICKNSVNAKDCHNKKTPSSLMCLLPGRTKNGSNKNRVIGGEGGGFIKTECKNCHG